ncbi:uncharacterized protein LOC143295040 [Babylonia areolata]|uniref:uncharacterized protein LOC143295040 n=1 Tax=Babylonia areolata TaxID=304850 RepID=UPI003FD37FD5
MHALTSALLLTVVMVTQGDEISENMQLPPLKQHIYLFDVSSEASVYDLKGALSDFKIDNSYKVIGEHRYMFEINTNDTALLRDLTFPAGSVVTQYPVEHMSEYLNMFVEKSGWEDYEQETLPDTVLMLCEWQLIIPENHCLQSFEREVQVWAEMWKTTLSIIKPQAYPVIANYPPRFFFIANIEENVLQTTATEGTTPMGGPGRARFAVKRIVKI